MREIQHHRRGSLGDGGNLGKALATFAADTNGQDVLNFLRGSSAQELRNSGQFRNRTHKLGDIVDSAPLYVGPPIGLSQTASYFSFAVSHKTRSPIIYVGANDGMLHAFDATTGVRLWGSGKTIAGPVFAAPIVVNGLLYVSSWDGKLHAFGL